MSAAPSHPPLQLARHCTLVTGAAAVTGAVAATVAVPVPVPEAWVVVGAPIASGSRDPSAVGIVVTVAVGVASGGGANVMVGFCSESRGITTNTATSTPIAQRTTIGTAMSDAFSPAPIPPFEKVADVLGAVRTSGSLVDAPALTGGSWCGVT